MFAGMASEVERLTCDLVAIESVNPDLVASGSGEANIGRFVADWLTDAGLEVEMVEPVTGRPSVVGVVRGSGGGRSLMLNAHMDTVGADGTKGPVQPSDHGWADPRPRCSGHEGLPASDHGRCQQSARPQVGR
jgi:acetylornithine deacetylase